MSIPCKFTLVSVAMFIGIAIAYADPVQLSNVAPATQIAALAPSATKLPNLTVYPAVRQPYTSGFSPRGGSENTVRAIHFRVWGGYDASVALHPYTSNIGPGPEAARIQPSRYERAPFTD